MIPIHFLQANHVLNAPEGASAVEPIHVFDDGKSYTSVWAPSDAERSVIANGGAIILTVLGHMHPPLFITSMDLIQQDVTLIR